MADPAHSYWVALDGDRPVGVLPINQTLADDGGDTSHLLEVQAHPFINR